MCGQGMRFGAVIEISLIELLAIIGLLAIPTAIAAAMIHMRGKDMY